MARLRLQRLPSGSPGSRCALRRQLVLRPVPVPPARFVARACTLSLLALLALLQLHATGVAADAAADAGPFGDRAVVRAPPQYTQVWSTNQAIPTTGFCLTEAEGRVRHNWTRPLYARRIVMAAEGGAGIPLLWSWVAKLLVQELIGHQVWWYDSAAPTDTFYNRLVLNPHERRVDIEILSRVQMDAPGEDYRAHVTGTGEVVQKGAHDQTNQPGIYLTRSSMERYPQYAMESWRAFSGGDNAPGEPPMYSSDSTLLHLFRNDSWKTLDSLRNVYGTMDMLKDSSGQPVCQPIMRTAGGRAFETGCTDPDYPSMYFPPQCYPNPRAQCALIFATTPVWIGGYLQGQVRTLNLSLGVAFLNVVAFAQPAFVNNPARLNLLMYSDANQQSTNNECAFGTGKLARCWHRMQLPSYTPMCAGLHNGNYTSAYSCDFPTSQQVKFARPTLALEAPRVDHFLQRLNFGPADTFWFFQQPEMQTGQRMQDHKSVACRWIRQAENRARWEGWIAPPAACTMADSEFVVSECDESTAEHTVTYSWRQPKACVGGWALPQPEKVSCGYVTAALSWQVACMAVAGVLLFFFAVVTVLRVLESWSIWRAGRRAAAQAGAAKARTRAGGVSKGFAALMSSAASNPSLFTAGIAFRRRMPIFSLCFRSFYPYNLAMLLLLLLPLTQNGPVVESMCWLRYAFTIGGVVIGLQVLATLLGSLVFTLKRSLQVSSMSNFRRTVWATDAVLLVSLLVGVIINDHDAIATEAELRAPGGGTLLLKHCTSPPVWMAAVHIALCCLWGLFVAVTTVSALLRVHFSNLFSGNAFTTRQKVVAAAAAVAAAARKKTGTITRVQLVQTDSLAVGVVIWLAASLVLLLPLYNMVDSASNEDTLRGSSITALLAVGLCTTALVVPSCWHAHKVSRAGKRGPTHATHAPTSSDGRVAPGTVAATAGGGRVSSNAAAPTSANISLSGDMLTGDSVNDHNSESTSLSLSVMLRDPILLLHFRRYAESHFDAEAVHFLLQCQTLYRQLRGATLNLTQVLGGLEAICDEFIVDGAPQQVNISSSLRDSTLAAVQDMRLSAVAQARNRLKPASAELKAQARKCLQQAVSEVYALVQVNSHPRFLNSAALRRSQHLLRWADGFDELDDEEQSAMMIKLREAQAEVAAAVRQLAEENHSQSGAVGGVGGGAVAQSLLGSSLRKSPISVVVPYSRVHGGSVVEMGKAPRLAHPTRGGGACVDGSGSRVGSELRAPHDQRASSMLHQPSMALTPMGSPQHHALLSTHVDPSAAASTAGTPRTANGHTHAHAPTPTHAHVPEVQLRIDVLPAVRDGDAHAVTDRAVDADSNATAHAHAHGNGIVTVTVAGFLASPSLVHGIEEDAERTPSLPGTTDIQDSSKVLRQKN